jgi:hypothetical protein
MPGAMFPAMPTDVSSRHFSLIATTLGLHPPSEAVGRVGNRAFSEFVGEGGRGGSTLKQCGRPSPATLSRADPPQTAFREVEVGGVQRETVFLESFRQTPMKILRKN